MQNPKNQCYQDEPISKAPVFKPMYNQSSTPKFQFEKISQIDDLLNKNDEIYKNLRMKLEQIGEAQRNITNNINTIRPIYYSSRQKQNSLHTMYDKFMFDSNEEEKTIVFDNYESSPIQTERPMNLFNMKKKIVEEEKVLIMEESRKNQQVNNVQVGQVLQQQKIQQHRKTNTNEKNSSGESTLNKQALSLSSCSPPQQAITSLTRLPSTHNNLTSSYLRTSQSAILDREKQTFYFLNKSYEPYVDSMVRMQFVDLDQRKKEIEKVYEQLRKQEEEIQRAYKDYKSGFVEMSKVTATTNNKMKDNVSRSPQKKSSPIRNFTKTKKQQSQLNNSKSSVVIKAQEIKTQMKSSISSGNFNRGNELAKIPQSNKKIEFSPIKSSVFEYCTQQLQTVDIPEKPLPMTARSHIFVPFNKLYKSPIIQMKNKNILVLARQSKLASQKTAQMKILDGKKYKFPQNIETDEQSLIRNIITKDHNIIAIVGGQTTLKKKLHMAIIAHSFEKIIKIISSKKYNCLTFSLSYQELIEKHENSSQRISNSIEINDETQMRIVIMEAQKTIEQIYDAIKRPHTSIQSSYISKNLNPSTKEKPKIVRFTKLLLMSGKQCVWTCNILSANQFTCDFLKNLEVKDIIWSINPLIKNYDEVSKTLNESTKYIESRIQN